MATYEELKKRAKKEYEEEQKNGSKNSSTQVKSGSSSYEDLKKRARQEMMEEDVKKVDSSYINSFLNTYNSFFGSAKKDYENVGYGNASSSYRGKKAIAQGMEYNRQVIQKWFDSEKDKLNDRDRKTLSEVLGTYDEQTNNVLNAFSKAKDYYSRWETEDDYLLWKRETETAYLKQKREKEKYDEMMAYDTVQGAKDIENFTKQVEADEKEYWDLYNMRTSYSYGMTPGQPDDVLMGIDSKMQEILDKYGAKNINELKHQITEKELYNTQVKRLQEKERLGSVGDKESEFYDPEYDYWAKTRGKLPTQEDLVAYDSMMDQSKWYTDANGKLFDAYGTEIDPYNTDDNGNIKHPSQGSVDSSDKLGIFLSASEDDVAQATGTYLNTGGTWETIVAEGSQRNWDQMDENEVNTYYYYLNKEGSEAAEQYLDSIQETLNHREGTEKFKTMEDKTALELLFKVAVGLDQFNSGMQGVRNAFTGNDEYIPATATQIAGSMVQEDLGDVGRKLPDWLGGGSVAQAAGDFITAGSNMLPSILASTVVGALNPAAGSAVGTGLLSASAGGNAYTEMINFGYDKNQARTYATLVGASEAVLQELLGGISKFGGGAIEKGVTKALGKADNVLAKLAIKFGNSNLGKVLINAAEEGSEEYFQSILEPWFKNIIFGEENEIDLLSEEALYSALLGALTGGVFEGSGIALEAVNNNAMLRDTGKAITGADGGVDALKALAMDVSGANPKLTNQANKVSSEPATGKGLVGKAVAAVKNSSNQKKVGKLYQAVEAEVTKQNQADITKALNENGFSKSSAKNIAEAVVAQASGVELNNFQKATLESVKGNKKVDEIVTKIINDPESGVSKRTGNLDAYSMGIMLGKGISPEATREAQKTTLKVSEEGKTTVNGNEINVEFSDNGMLTTAEGTVAVSDVEYSTATEAYVVETIANLGLKADAANSLLRTANAKGMNDVQAQAFALGLKNAYNIGRIGNLTELTKNYFTAQLTAEQRETAYSAGLRERNAEVAARQTAINEAQKKADEILAAKSEPIDKSGSVIFENGVTKKDLSKKQKAAYLVARKVSSTMGNDIHLYSGKAEYGFHDAETGDVWLNINASASGKDLTLFTLSHEMVHHAQLWSPEEFTAFADMLLEAYGEKGVSVEQMIKKQIRKAKDHGITLTREAAYEEVIADACGRMLIDSNALEKLSLLEETNPGIIEKIKAFLQEFLKKIREMFKDVQPHTNEAIYLAEMEESVKTLLYEKFENLMVSTGKTYSTIKAAYGKDVKAVPNYEIITDGAVTIEGDGKKYSIKSMKHDIAEGKMFDDLRTVCGWTEAETTALKEQLEDIVSYMIPFRDIVDMNETSGRDDRRFSPYKPNSDPLYTISMDFSTLCSKRLLTQYVIENLQLRENRPMSAEEQIAIRDMLIEYRQQEKALQVACAMCYVEAARLKSPKQMERWLNDPASLMRNYFATQNPEFKQKIKNAQADFKESRGYDRTATKKEMKQKDVTELNKIGPRMYAEYIPSAEEQAIIDKAVTLPNSTYLTAGNLADLSESDPVIYKAYTSFVRTATRSKGLEQDIAYYYGDSTRDNGNGIIVSDSFIDSVNQENGMRFSSWSDWRIEHLLDYITAVIDNSVRGAAMHGYTKFPDEVRVLGNTGMMFNMSGVAGTQTGLNEDGSLSFSETESINFEEAKALREEFPETAGLQCIGVGDEHIRQLLRSDIIDYVIPYHTSGLNAVLRRMVNIHGWKDYTGTQHATPDKSISKDKAKDPENWHKEPVFSEFFVGYKTGLTGVEAMKKTAENYIRMCQDRGLTPKFAQFMNEDGYWKLLIDRKMVNNKTGELIQQKPVKPVFNTETIKGIVNNYVDNYDSGLQSKALNHVVENWDSLPARIKDLKKAKKSKTKKALDTLANETVAAKPGRKFALPNGTYDYSKSFAEQIEDYKAVPRIFPQNDNLVVGATPNVFLKIGLARLPMTYGQKHLADVLAGNKQDHDFGEEILKQLPRALKEPVAIIASKTHRTTSLVAILEFSHQGKRIVSAVLIDGVALTNGRNIDSHAITTMHKRSNADTLLADAIQAEANGTPSVFYVDKNKTTRVLQSKGLQLPQTLQKPSGYIRSITDPDSPVKPKLTNQHDSKQFKLWFKGSKAVNNDGTPMDLYHYTDADFDAFDVSLSGSNQGQTHGDGIYLSSSKDAFAYAGKKQMVFHARIKKPFEMKLTRKQATFILEKYAATKHDLDKYNGLYRNHAMAKLLSPTRVFDYLDEYAADNGIKVSDILKDLGFDGVHDGNEWVAFEPTQVKSAYYNIGLFDENNPKFRFSLPDVDSAGKQITEDQIEYFENTVVKDRNGNLQVVYHGGTVEYEFDTARGGNGDTQYGPGSYFTDSEYYAKEYTWYRGGNVRAYYLNIEKLFDDTYMDMTVKTPEWKRLEQILRANGIEDKFIEKFRDNGFAYMSRYLALKSGAKTSGSWEGSEKLNAMIREAGFDGIKGYLNDSTQYVIFTPNQAKLTTNEVPSGFYDVRYSLPDSDDISTRSLLANAFESVAQNEKEQEKLAEYKAKIAFVNAKEKRLREINAKLFQSNTPIPKSERIALQDEAVKLRNQITVYDSQLLRLEASKPLQNVLNREKAKVRKQMKEQAKEDIRQAKLEEQQRYKNRVANHDKVEMRKKIRKTIRDLDKILNHGDKKKNVKDDMKGLVTSAIQSAEVLFTENYTNEDIIQNGFGVQLGAEEQKHFVEAQKILEQMFNLGTGYEAMAEREKLKNKLSYRMAQLRDAFFRERNRLNETRVSEVLGNLADAYASLESSEHLYIKDAYHASVHEYLKYLQNDVGGTTVRNMSMSQLENLHKAYTMVLETVRNANKMFNEKLKEGRDQLANAIMREVRMAGGEHGDWTKGGIRRNKFSWNNLKPIYAAERIGSETFGRVVNGLFEGQYKWATTMEKARAFQVETAQKYGVNNWDMEQAFKFTSSNDLEFTLNLEQILALYAYSKRDAAHDHITNGGIVFGKNTEVVENKHGIKVHKLKRSATTYSISDTLLGEIISKLDDSQRKYVDDMQKYLSETMGGLGNEVSMKLYGVKLFGEENYFPLRSAGQYMEKAREADLQKQQGHTSLVNSGFTHAVKPHAKNPIVLDGFMDVWAGHVNEMAMYSGMVLPMEDFRKVYNYHTPFGEGSTSVNGVIENAYGAEATNYFDQLYQELNSGAISDPRETDMMKWVGKFKKAAVMASMSVVVQQPSAIGRAFALIDPKHFVGQRISESDTKKQWDEVKKYAPVAIIKEMGGFDTHTGASAKDFLLAKEYSKEEIGKALKDKEFRKEKADMIMGYLPAKADEITWVSIWQAVKRETKAKNPNLHGEEFLKKAGERFSEVIEKTQVYDSILARSANMRAKTGLMTMATAFLAEPTTTINMVENAIRSKKNVGRVLASVVTTIILNNLLASAIYAMRDDDDDETWWEKYAQAFTSGMVDDLNPVTYYPFLKDVWSIFQGYDVERSDMSIISDVSDALKKVIQLLGEDTSEMDEDELAEYHKRTWSAALSLADGAFSALGVPFKNARREVESWFNTYNTATNGLPNNSTSLMNTIVDASMDALPVASYLWKPQKSDRLYDAIIDGNTAYEERLRSEYADEKQITNAIRKGLRENDSRIYEAALAQIDNKPEDRVKLQRQVIADGFTQDDVVSATNSIISKLSPSGSTSEPKKKGLYTTEDFALFVSGGKTALANEAKKDIIATHQLNGKTQADAEKSFQSSAKSDLKEMFMAGTVTVAVAEHALKTYCGMADGEAKTTASEWNYFKTTGIDYSDKKEKYIAGEMSASELAKALMSVGGKTEKEAASTVVSYTRDAYEEGNFSRSKAASVMIEYGGLTEAEAESKLQYIDVKKQLPDTYVDDAWVAEYYKEVESSGISIETFVDYRNQVKSITGEGKKEKRMEVINSMPISKAQKDALYYAEGWAASRLYEAPWR